MEDRQQRIFLAILMSLGLWMAFNYFLFPPVERKQASNNGKKVEAIASESKPEDVQIKTDQKLELPKQDTQTPKFNPEDIKKYYIKTDSFLIQLSSLGGKIERFYIKNYKHIDGTNVLITKDSTSSMEFNGETFQAVEISRGKGFDFNPINSIEEASISPYLNVNFKSFETKETNSFTFETDSLDSKTKIKKEFRFFSKENYFKFKYSITNTGTSTEILGMPNKPYLFRSFSSLGPHKLAPTNDRDQVHFFRYYYLDGSFKDSIDGTSSEGFFSNLFGQESKDKRFTEVPTKGDGFDFFGVGSRYFIAVLDPLNHRPSGVILDNRDGNTTGVIAEYDSIKLAPGETETFDFAAYTGIREEDGMVFRDNTLNPVESKESPFIGLSEKLNKSFNQGLTTPFRNGIIWIFKKLYLFLIPNYGWCIIVFSLLLKLVFYPLNQKQAESMKKMQELNPLIQEINVKYEKDPALKQQKIMELYKKNNANPVSGCLPMLVQIPIFIALYTAFSDTIDLWKSPFLWINDLSEPDTVWISPIVLGSSFNLNLLPIIMVGTQIVQTRMTSVSTDPNQKIMMYMMPVIMTFFFWSMPSGVTLYWTTQNFFSIAQQYYTNRFVETKKKQKENISIAQISTPTTPPVIRQNKGPRKGKR